MATTTKKNTTPSANVKATESKEKNESLEKENDTLKTELENMKKQMEEMMSKMQAFSNMSNMFNMVQSQSNYADKDIEVVSLVTGQLILSTTGRSDGKIYKFNEQFEEQSIPVSDLKAICSSMKRTAMNGKFFINDAEFVREAGLNSSYRNILDRVQLSNVLNLSVDEFIAKYNAIPNAQKDIICSMIKDKRMNGEFVDGNILIAMKQLTGVDFASIEKLPEEYKVFKEV